MMADSSILGPQRFEVIVDRDRFEKELHEALSKALNATEAPPKEKHVRSTLIATWRERGCNSFWKVIKQFPFLRSHIVGWKACFVIHRIFRDGHPDVVKKSATHIKFLSEVGKHWSHAVAGYAPLITAYIRVLMTRISFIVKNPELPSNLNFEDKPFQIPSDIDHTFQLAVEVFDAQSSILHLYAAVLTNLDPSKGVSAQQVQCRLAPLIPAIQDSAALYDVIFKLMKALHSSLPAETLQGHRDRFNRQYQALRKYFHEASKMKYLQNLVKIPDLDPEPPSFLLPGQLIEIELAKQVKVQIVPVEEESITSQIVDTTPPPASENVFDSTFGRSGFSEGFDFQPQPPKKDERDALIEQLMREIVELKEKISELQSQREADRELMAGLRDRLQQMETELNDYKEIAEQTCNENVLLKRQIEESTVAGAHSEAAEARAKAADEKFVKLREVYQKLRGEHITLLRTNGENQKKLLTVEKAKMDAEGEAKDLEQKIATMSLELEEIKVHAEDEAAQKSVLRDELRRKEAESIRFEQAQQSLSEQLKAKEQEAPHQLIVQAVEEAESLIRRVLDEIGSAGLSGTTCTPKYLMEKTKVSLDIIDSATSAFSLYNNDNSAIGKALASLPSLSHALSEVIMQGAALSHTTSAEDETKLMSSSEAIGADALKFLQVLKKEKPGSGSIAASANDLQKLIRQLERLAGTVSRADEESPVTLGNLVDEEMAATSQVIEAAAQRIQEMLQKSREDDTGVKLEVNERILDSCTDLMKAIRVLIQRSKDLQNEIVKEGMGKLTDTNEFYKKNSRWSEGLISAAKQVGWGASVLVDAADKVVQGTGKFEELVVASHDIAASTAQLVAASRVKARPKSEKLKSLKVSSRNVSEATGQVVASAQSGSQLRRQGSQRMDYSKLSLTQTKRLEMESQVKALELEKELEMERTRLAELRKVHYHLAGASEGWEEEQTEN